MIDKEQLKHFDYLLCNCIGYLWEIWHNEDRFTILQSFKNLNFNEEDLQYFGIYEDLKELGEMENE